MPGCAVADCNNYNIATKGSGIKYFSFPKDEEFCKKWIIACSRKDEINLKNACICSAHFEPHCFAEPSLKHKLLNYSPKNIRTLKTDVVPTLNIPGRENKNTSESSAQTVKRRKTAESETPWTDTNNSLDIMINDESSSNALLIVKKSERKDPLCKKSKTNEQKEILDLKKKLQHLERENLILKGRLKHSDKKIKNMEEMIGKVFTPGQVKKLFNPYDKRVKWSPEDIASALSLRSVSPKAYHYLKSQNYPLPAFSTLRKWAAIFPSNRQHMGVLNDDLDDDITLMDEK